MPAERNRHHPLRFARGFAVIVALTLLASESSAQAAAPSIEPGDTIRITRRFFGLRYVAGNLPERPVIEPWLGLSLHSSFRDVLARHPAALEEARKASPGMVLSFLGQVGVAVGLFLITSDALGQVDDFSSGSASDGGNRGVAVALGSLGVTVVGSMITRGHIDRSIATFNTLQRQSVSNRGDSFTDTRSSPRVRVFAAPASTGIPGRPGLRVGVSFAGR